jgi:hypothetical protein
MVEHAASRKSRKPKARSKTLRKSDHAAKRRTGAPKDEPEMVMPWTALPFVKVVKGPQSVRHLPEWVDYWAPPEEPSGCLAAEFLGSYYALLAIRHAHEQEPGLPVLSWIVNDMIKQGRPLWPGADSDAPMNVVAMGFVATLTRMALRADGWGLLSDYALRFGTQLMETANSKERMSRSAREVLREHGERLLAFSRTPIVKRGQRSPSAATAPSEAASQRGPAR